LAATITNIIIIVVVIIICSTTTIIIVIIVEVRVIIILQDKISLEVKGASTLLPMLKTFTFLDEAFKSYLCPTSTTRVLLDEVCNSKYLK